MFSMSLLKTVLFGLFKVWSSQNLLALHQIEKLCPYLQRFKGYVEIEIRSNIEMITFHFPDHIIFK